MSTDTADCRTRPICVKCNLPIEENSYIYENSGPVHMGCMLKGDHHAQQPTGWICPKCGRGVAPWASDCSCYLTWQIY